MFFAALRNLLNYNKLYRDSKNNKAVKIESLVSFDDKSNQLSPPKAEHPQKILAGQNNFRSPIRRLDFDKETQIKSSNVILEIDKVADIELPQFPQPVDACSKDEFYQIRSSPINRFNSFAIQSTSVTRLVPQQILPEETCTSEAPIFSHCSCKKSRCLKLYCECFSRNAFCHNCDCECCLNNDTSKQERKEAMKATLMKNPTAFSSKNAYPATQKINIGNGKGPMFRGCHCERSGCIKKYCECFQRKINCSSFCQCKECHNLCKGALYCRIVPEKTFFNKMLDVKLKKKTYSKECSINYKEIPCENSNHLTKRNK